MTDLKFAVRMLLHSSGFSLTAILILTLGIGATATMFSATSAVLLRPLPYPDPDRLVVVRETRAQAQFAATVMTAKEFVDWTRNSPVLDHAALVGFPGLAVAIGDEPDRLPALRVTADFFPLFGATPVAGRAFTREDEEPGNGDVAVISYRLWQERFAGSASTVGGVVRVEGRPTTIVGILPEGFTFTGPFDLIVPMTLSPDALAETAHSWDVFARLAPGVSRAQAIQRLSAAAVASQGSPAHLTGATLVPMRDVVVGDGRAPLLVMFGAVGFVLLIACANIANLLLARGASRTREMAIRSALGAGRRRVVRQLLAESLVLTLAGGVGGALLAAWLTEIFARLAANAVPRASEIHVGGWTLLFTFAVASAAGIAVGLVPAWQTAHADVNDALKLESRGATGGRRRALGVFVVAEVALAMVLLVGAGLLLATFDHLRQVDPGFDPSDALVVPSFLPQWKYGSPDAQRAFIRRATQEIAAVPGVVAAGATDALPLSGDNMSGTITIEGRPAPDPATRPNADWRSVTPGYFPAMGISLLSGRLFAETDDERAAGVLLVSRGFAEHYWPGESAVGKRLKLARFEADAPWRTVVGVVADVQHESLGQPPRPVLYRPYAQGPVPWMQIVVRSASTPSAIAGALRQAMHRTDPELPVRNLRPLTAYLSDALAQTKMALSLLGAFALMAIGLAAAGIYGVMAYAVAQRRAEFGIRLALGASPRDLLRLVVAGSLRLTAAGIILGLIGARVTSSLLGTLIVGVTPTDPRVFVGMAMLLAAVALAASLVPAVRAMRVDPNSALGGRP